MSSTGQAAAKPSLSGVRIKARKGAAKAQAKHEPAVFRDQLYKHLEVVPPEDFDAVTNKLIQAGSTLEYQKYADAFFEILLAGGLLQPGGATFIEDGAPPAPFSILKAKEPVEIDDMKKYADVFHKVIRRYKYMQKPLEEVSLPGLIQCAHRWPEAQREKFSVMLGLLLSQGLASASAVQVLSKDHLVKDGFSLQIISSVFKAFLKDQGIDQLSSCLKKGGIKDIMEFFPVNRRTLPNLEAFFKEKGLPVVAEWYNKKRSSAMKEIIVAGLKEAVEHEESEENMIAFIKERQEEQPIPEGDLVACVWTGLMATVDWGARPDQLESLVIKEVTKFAPILEAFCNGPKTEVQLINTVQVFCYEESRIMKTFLQIIKILYNKDCISDQAIMYWHSKGSKPQGRQHFVKATEPLINFLKAQEDESEEE